MLLVAEYGHYHDVGRGIAARGIADDFNAGTVGQTEVQDDECRLRLVDLRARFGAGCRVLDDEVRVTQVERHKLGDRRIVLDDDDARGHRTNAKREAGTDL